MASILNVDKVRATGSTTDGLTIDSSGRVLMPEKPAWRLGVSAATNLTASTNQVVDFSTAESGYGFLRGGCTVSSGVVTVPVSGVYQVQAKFRSGATGYGDATAVAILKNNSQYSRVYVTDNPHPNYSDVPALISLVELDANDTVSIRINPGAAGNVNTLSDGVNWFEGYLVA